MPKMKTKRAAAKRFRVNGSGKIKRAKAGRRHILSNKNRKRKRRLGEVSYVSKQDHDAVQRLIPYASA